MWLVRTSSGEILGPYTEEELYKAYRDKTFQHQDEICSSENNKWISIGDKLLEEDDKSYSNTNTQEIIPRDKSFSKEKKEFFLSSPMGDIVEGNPEKLRDSYHFSLKNKYYVLFLTSLLGLMGFFLVYTFTDIKKYLPFETHSLTPSSASNTSWEEQTKKLYTMIYADKPREALEHIDNQLQQLGYVQSQSIADFTSNPVIVHLFTLKQALIIYEHGQKFALSDEEIETAKNNLIQISHTQAIHNKIRSMAYLWTGIYQLLTKEEDFGIQNFSHGLEIYPNSIENRYNLAISYFKKSQFEKSIETIEWLTNDIPHWIIPFFQGEIFSQTPSKKSQALLKYKQALDLDPSRFQLYFHYAKELYQQKNQIQAIDTMAKMLTEDPEYETQTQLPFGFYNEPRNMKEYITLYSTITQSNKSVDIKVGKIYLNYLDSRLLSMAELSELALQGGLTSHLLQLKICSETYYNNPSLLTTIKNIIKKLPPNLAPFGYYGYIIRARALEIIGSLDKAKEDYLIALSIQPDSVVVMWNIYQFIKNHPEFEEELLKAKSNINSPNKELLHSKTDLLIALFNKEPNYIPARKEAFKLNIDVSSFNHKVFE